MDFKVTLTKNQIIIYEIAKDYLQKQPHFTTNDLFLACKKKTKLSINEISTILEKFIRKKIFVPGSRLTRETVLDNKKRNELYQLIFSTPALNLNRLLTRVDLGQQLGYWHLGMLKKFELIREKKIMNYTLYFLHDFPRGKETIIFLLRNPNILKIYLCLKNHPLNPNILSKILDLHYTTVKYHLNHLQQNKMIYLKDNNTYSINLEHESFVERYYDLTSPIELKEKIEEYLKNKKAASPSITDQ